MSIAKNLTDQISTFFAVVIFINLINSVGSNYHYRFVVKRIMLTLLLKKDEHTDRYDVKCVAILYIFL